VTSHSSGDPLGVELVVGAPMSAVMRREIDVEPRLVTRHDEVPARERVLDTGVTNVGEVSDQREGGLIVAWWNLAMKALGVLEPQRWATVPTGAPAVRSMRAACRRPSSASWTCPPG
jgi:hypothetical protein